MWLVIPRGRVLVASSKPLCLQSIATANAIFRQNALLSQGRWEPALLNQSSCEGTSSVGPTPLLLAPGSVSGQRALLQLQCSEAQGRPAGESAVSWWALCTTQPHFPHKLPRWTPQLLMSTRAGLCSGHICEEPSLGPGKEPQAKTKQGGNLFKLRHLFKCSLNRMCCLPVAHEFQEMSGTIVSGFCLLAGS